MFAEKLPAKGLLVVNSGIEKVEEITRGLKCRVVTFGKDLSSTYTARNITYDGFARPSYDPVSYTHLIWIPVRWRELNRPWLPAWGWGI